MGLVYSQRQLHYVRQVFESLYFAVIRFLAERYV